MDQRDMRYTDYRDWVSKASWGLAEDFLAELIRAGPDYVAGGGYRDHLLGVWLRFLHAIATVEGRSKVHDPLTPPSMDDSPTVQVKTIPLYFKTKVYPAGFAPVVEEAEGSEYDDLPLAARSAVFRVAQERALADGGVNAFMRGLAQETPENNHKEE